MNNQEKAREIELNVYAFEKPKGEFEAPAYRAALEMADWKDQQFKEYLEKTKKEIDEIEPYCDADNFARAERIDLINEIINELLGGEKDCTTCKWGFKDEQLGIPLCHHPERFSKDCDDSFNLYEIKDGR